MPEIISDTIQLHVVSYDDFLKDYEFLILQRSDKSELYPLAWQVITGRIKESETALQAALRELFEETRLKPSKLWCVPYTASYFDVKRDAVCFAPVFGAFVSDKMQLKLSEEHAEAKWLSLEISGSYCMIPSHRIGTKVFWDYILSQKDKSLYEIKEF